MRTHDIIADIHRHRVRMATAVAENAPRLLPKWTFQVDISSRGDVSLLAWLPWLSPDTHEYTLKFTASLEGDWQGRTPEGQKVGRSRASLGAAVRGTLGSLVSRRVTAG